jgi:hypothetical protein
MSETIMLALSNSRTLPYESEEYSLFFDTEEGETRYAARVAMLMEKYGYKTKRALFNNMNLCNIHLFI